MWDEAKEKDGQSEGEHDGTELTLDLKAKLSVEAITFSLRHKEGLPLS